MSSITPSFTLGCYWIIWATSWEKLFLPYPNDKGTDQPAHPCSPISAFVVRYLDSIISKQKLVFVAEQAGLCLTWSQTPKTGFLVTWLILSMLFHNFVKFSLWNVMAAITMSIDAHLTWLRNSTKSFVNEPRQANLCLRAFRHDKF